MSSSPASDDKAEVVASTSSPTATTAESSASTTKAPSPSTTNNSMPNPSPPNQQSSTTSAVHSHQQYVDHSYTDYANVDEDDLRLMKEAGDTKGGIAQSKLLLLRRGSSRGPSHGPSRARPVAHSENGNSVLPFPGKLLEVLDRGDLSAIIDWMSHGRAFIVKQPKIFAAQVLPRFFKQTKFLSFTRQLNLWGFKRITRGIDAGAYYHELFLPGRTNLSMRMKRQKIKGTGIRPIPNPDEEPNFYYNYPHVPRVPMSNVPLPLPPLPTERIANLMQGEDPSIGVMTSAVCHQAQYPYGAAMLQANFPGVLAPGMSMAGYQAAPAAMAPASNGYPSLDPRRMSNYYPEAVLRSSADLDLELASRLYMQRANSLSAASDKTDGEQSDANRRLMERLMDQTSIPTDSFLHQSVASEAIRRQSFQASRMVTAPAPAASSPPVSLSAIQHESLKTKRLSPPSTAATTSPMSSLYGARDFAGGCAPPAPAARQGMPSMPKLPIGSQDINLHTVMRDAQHLEELARSQRANAQVLARYLYNQES